jgi:hypothetical protein
MYFEAKVQQPAPNAMSQLKAHAENAATPDYDDDLMKRT